MLIARAGNGWPTELVITPPQWGIRPNDATEVRSSLTGNLGYARAHPPRASRSTGYARSIGATRLQRRPPVTGSANLGDDGPGGPHPRRFAGARDARPSF